MAKARRLAVFAAIAVMVVVGFVGDAEADQFPKCTPTPTYPPPTGCKLPKNPCARTSFKWKIGKKRRVTGKAGCAAAGVTVEVFLRSSDGSTEISLGTTVANAKGKYKLKVPVVPNVTTGSYVVVVRLPDGTEFTYPIVVALAGSFSALTDRSPGSYAILSIWTLVLLSLAFFLVYAPRRGLRLLPSFGRLRFSSNKVPALPPPDVPFLDTRGFVPTHPQEPEGPAVPPEDDWGD
jgi:hypothetical protein